jgi:hypothetical protein
MDIRQDITGIFPISALAMGIRPIAIIVTILIIMDIALIIITIIDPDISVGEVAIIGEVVMAVGEVAIIGEVVMVVAEVMVGEDVADSEISVCVKRRPIFTPFSVRFTRPLAQINIKKQLVNNFNDKTLCS